MNLEIQNSNENKLVDSAESILSSASTFTIPDVSKIHEYSILFDILLRNKNVQETFKIVKRIDQKSANGIIYVVKLRKSKEEHNKLLVKVQRSQFADPPSYEYYVGKVLNTLRGMNVPNFALVYGRFRCGYDDSGRTLCDPLQEKRTHVLYEYITSLSDKTITLSEYIDTKTDGIRKTINVINILMMLLISLQKAQDNLNFTHYDLHLSNVLLVELNATYTFAYEYKGNTYNIILDYFPFIIDYGRSHVDPDIVDKILREPIVDLDTKKSYDDFYTYQNEMWDNRTFSTKHDDIVKLIEKKMHDPVLVKELRLMLAKNWGFDVDKTYEVDDVIDLFYKIEDDDDVRRTSWLEPKIYNPYYDHHKLLMHVCNKMEHRGLGKSVFDGLRNKLNATFPFYDPDSYGVSDTYNYLKFSGTMRRPIDVVKWLWNLVKDDIKPSQVTYKDVSFSQLGGTIADDYYRRVYQRVIKK
jgi:hypothetical protein